MTNNPMLSVGRELLEEMLAAMKETYSLPAKYYGSTLGDRVRAILESQNEQAEPLAIGTLHRDCDERIVFESSGEIHIKDGMQVYAAPAAQRKGDPVALQHMAVSEGGVLRWMTGRKMQDCELYAMPDGSAIRSKLYAEQPASVAVVQTCKIGIYGKAYDLPETKRAYTYEEQPDNVAASKIGRAACLASAGGDSIDHGLSLLKALSDEGFGVFEITMPNGVNL